MSNEALIAEAEYVMKMLSHPKDGIWGRLITALTASEGEARKEILRLRAEVATLKQALQLLDTGSVEGIKDDAVDVAGSAFIAAAQGSLEGRTALETLPVGVFYHCIRAAILAILKVKE